MVVSRGLETGRKIVMPLSGGETTVTEHGRGDPHVIGMVYGDRSGGEVPKKVRVNPPAKGVSGAFGNLKAERVGCLRDKEIPYPQSVAAIPLAHEEGPIASEIPLQTRRELLRERHVDRLSGLCLSGRKTNAPALALSHEVPVQGQPAEVPAPQRARGQKRDLQPVAVDASILPCVLVDALLGLSL